jgi:hypothetical protein
MLIHAVKNGVPYPKAECSKLFIVVRSSPIDEIPCGGGFWPWNCCGIEFPVYICLQVFSRFSFIVSITKTNSNILRPNFSLHTHSPSIRSMSHPGSLHTSTGRIFRDPSPPIDSDITNTPVGSEPADTDAASIGDAQLHAATPTSEFLTVPNGEVSV